MRLKEYHLSPNNRQENKIIITLVLLTLFISIYLIGIINSPKNLVKASNLGSYTIPSITPTILLPIQSIVIPSLSPVQIPVPTMDPVNLQLIEQVKSGITYIHLMLIVFGIVLTLFTIFAGFSFWRIVNYANSSINGKFSLFGPQKIEPIVETSKNELTELSTQVIRRAKDELNNISNQGTFVLLKTSQILSEFNLYLVQEDYKLQLELRNTPLEETKKLLHEREHSIRSVGQVEQYLIASLSRDPMIVKNACQFFYAYAKAKNRVLLSELDFILEQMNNLLASWPSESTTRAEIRSLIEELERLKDSD